MRVRTQIIRFGMALGTRFGDRLAEHIGGFARKRLAIVTTLCDQLVDACAVPASSVLGPAGCQSDPGQAGGPVINSSVAHPSRFRGPRG